MSTSTNLLEAIRESKSFEWAFALAVTNLVVQFYRMSYQLISFIFDALKVSSALDLIWPSTLHDIKAVANYVENRYATLLNFLEGLTLLIVAYFGVDSLLKLQIPGILIYAVAFIIHSGTLAVTIILFRRK